MKPEPPPRKSAVALSRRSRWTTRLLADERKLLLDGIRADQRILWLSPTAGGKAPDGHAILELWPVSLPLLAGDIDQTAADWPFQDDSLDQVVLQHAAESGVDYPALIAEALRVLRPEGSLWQFGCGRFGWPRLCLAWPGSERHKLLCAPSPLVWQRALADRGCVDIEARSLRRDAGSQLLLASPGASWASPLLLLHARKRRSASILGVRRRPVFKAPPLHALGPSPASRGGLAA